MRAITTLLSGLLLSAVFLFPAAIRAAELEPFLTVKASSINTFIGAAEKIAEMADAADDFFFLEAIGEVRNIRGFNFDGNFGIAAVVTEDDSLSFLFLLPITDIWAADFPANPDLFGAIRPFLARRGAGRTDINTPFGIFAALQKQGHLVIVPEGIVNLVPADPRTLFADIERYTFGMKLDLEKVEFETLEANLFAPMLFFMMMQAPEMAEQLEEAIEMYRELYNEFAMVSYGIAFDPQTANAELSYSFAPRAGSNMATMLAGYEQRPTIFGGFRGTPANTVFSFGDSMRAPALPNQDALMQLGRQQWETILDGVIEQIEMDDETGEVGEIAREAIDSIFRMIEAESQRGESDSALSFNVDGILLSAFDTVSLAEIQALAIMAWDFARSRAPAGAEELVEVSLGYTTIEGFTVSRFKLPLTPLVETFAGRPAPAEMPVSLRALALNGFWAVKPGDKQALAFAVGLDAAKTEQAFRSALQQTRTAVPVQKPVAVFSLQGLGKFLQQTIQPIGERALVEAPRDEFAEQQFEEFKVFADVLASAGAGATATMNVDMAANRVDAAFRVSGELIKTVISAFREVAVMGARPAIRGF